jgi:hypothetical protein
VEGTSAASKQVGHTPVARLPMQRTARNRGEEKGKRMWMGRVLLHDEPPQLHSVRVIEDLF